MPSLDDDPATLADYIAERQMAKKFLFWAFVISVMFIHVAYTYLMYRQYTIFVNAFATQFACNLEDAIERDTARYTLRQHYLEPDDKTNALEIRRYNFWRIWVLSMPVMIAIAIFMIVKYSFNVIPPYLYLCLTIVVLYLGIYQIVHLPRYFGYPSYWDVFAEKMMNGKLQNAIQYHTQGYEQIHLMFESRLNPFLEGDAAFSCMELLTEKQRTMLIDEYMRLNPNTNKTQATEFFEEAFKRKNYSVVIDTYMKLGANDTDKKKEARVMLESQLAPCLAAKADFSNMELVPGKLRSALIRRYMSVHPETNQYQATEFFEEAFKQKKYDLVIGYMKLGTTSDDLDLLAANNVDDEALNTFRSNFSKDLIDEINGFFKDAFWKIIVPGWILLIYFIWFHKSFQRWFLPDTYVKDDDIDPSLNLFWVLVVGIWFLLVFVF